MYFKRNQSNGSFMTGFFTGAAVGLASAVLGWMIYENSLRSGKPMADPAPEDKSDGTTRREKARGRPSETSEPSEN